MVAKTGQKPVHETFNHATSKEEGETGPQEEQENNNDPDHGSPGRRQDLKGG